MPDIYYYYINGGKEYFHPESGMENGSWAENGGAALTTKIRNFYKTVFDVPYNADENDCVYSLYGSKTVSEDPEFNGSYHRGIDIKHEALEPVYTAHGGTVTAVENNRIGIYDSNKNVTYFYLHCIQKKGEDGKFFYKVGEYIGAGSEIGTESNRGLGYSDYTTNAHVHFEVLRGNKTNVGYPPKDIDSPLVALNPYDYI